jgi:hypothetical protein
MPFTDKITQTSQIDRAIRQYNNAIDLIEDNQPDVSICRNFFNCLNNIQDVWVILKNFHRGEGEGFRTMILEMLGENSGSIEFFLNSKELQRLSEFSPPILDHDTLRSKGYLPNQEIPLEVANIASSRHRRLLKSLKEYYNNQISAFEVLENAARLLYLIRSNIAHGGKDDGTFEKKAERDNLVSRETIPLQRLLIEHFLNNPSKRLACYGTLAPGKANNSILPRDGIWEKCSICGKLEINKFGYLVFTWDPNGDKIEASMLSSDNLPNS